MNQKRNRYLVSSPQPSRNRKRAFRKALLLLMMVLAVCFGYFLCSALYAISDAKAMFDAAPEDSSSQISVLPWQDASKDAMKDLDFPDSLLKDGLINHEAILSRYQTVKPCILTREESLASLTRLSRSYPELEDVLSHEADCSDELLNALANNPEMAVFALGYCSDDKTFAAADCALTTEELEKDWPLFLQWDSRWGYEAYGELTIGLAGCGPTCLSMAAVALTKNSSYTPAAVARMSMEKGFYVAGIGTSWDLMTDGAAYLGLTGTTISLEEQTLKSALDSGQAVILSLRAGDFTATGHFILLWGYGPDGFYVNDPNSVLRSAVPWSYEQLKPQIKNLWGFRAKHSLF